MERALSVIWGPDIIEDVFKRWVQGFVFSSHEPLALMQFSGGPCAVLAPVQAFILQKHLYEDKKDDISLHTDTWRNCSEDGVQSLLVRAMVHILQQASPMGQCTIAILNDKSINDLTHQVWQNRDHYLHQSAPPKTPPLQAKQLPKEQQTPPPAAKLPSASSLGSHKRKRSSSTEEEMEIVTNSKRESISSDSQQKDDVTKMDILPPNVMESLMRRAADEGERKRGNASGLKLTVEYLSSALSNVLQQSPGKQQQSGGTTPATPPNVSTTALKGVEQKEANVDLGSSLSHQELVSGHQQTRTPQAPPPTTTPTSSSLLPLPLKLPKNFTRSSILLSKLLHMNIRLVSCRDIRQTSLHIQHNINDFTGPFGVLLFLYSLVLTKGVDYILEEREENEQSLVDSVHGHGSQALVNLLLVGCAVTNVFDLDKDLGGIKLRGIPHQSSVGFLTLLEALRYCEVGSFLKSPIHPIWVIGSETHLTVAFSNETRLASQEKLCTIAIREFDKLDQNGCGFINTSQLGQLLQLLDLETDPTYVSFMQQKLDSEKLGVILLNDFLTEFFPAEMEIESPKAFLLYHYNGLQRAEGKVQFQRGNAVILGEEGGTSTEATLLNCLHTKWPGLVIHWDTPLEPKII